ncbi:hypothetical protein F2P44_03910 [Massilia sp. CCM 8695]|uniref:Uncharacterized protein n=1 Tax=Massilia frigida TaxID=2609281 RepID=A0ABX0N057_9BURK|nr:hypothetical protein [Massilia frigida]
MKGKNLAVANPVRGTYENKSNCPAALPNCWAFNGGTTSGRLKRDVSSSAKRPLLRFMPYRYTHLFPRNVISARGGDFHEVLPKN